eukprot:1030636-Pleurochrysis_carterae.AAC.1
MEIAEPLSYMSDGDAWPYGSEAVPEQGRERRQERRWLAAHQGGLPTRNPDGEVEHIPHKPLRTCVSNWPLAGSFRLEDA